jgi:hypothetical protein
MLVEAGVINANILVYAINVDDLHHVLPVPYSMRRISLP